MNGEELGPLSLRVGNILLDRHAEHTTYVISKRFGLRPGSVFKAMQELKKRGWVTSQVERTEAMRKKPNRVIYSVTDIGFDAIRRALQPFQIIPAST